MAKKNAKGGASPPLEKNPTVEEGVEWMKIADGLQDEFTLVICIPGITTKQKEKVT